VSTRPAYPVAARALLRDTLLDAVGDLLRERGWNDVPMAEVARRAGVSRQTLYNEFGDRTGIAQAYVLREAESFLADVEAAIDRRPGDPRGAVAAAFEVFLTSASRHPIVHAIATGQGEGLLALVTTGQSPVVELATVRLATMLADGWPQLGAGDSQAVAECVVRLGISYATLPTGPPRSTAQSLARVLGPFLDEAFAAARRADAA
jgi:AcrR family transcriptional regulator